MDSVLPGSLWFEEFPELRPPLDATATGIMMAPGVDCTVRELDGKCPVPVSVREGTGGEIVERTALVWLF
jgi:hypothetical protein